MTVKPPLHVVMHVPKTGGTSIAGGLQRTLGTNRVLRSDWFDQLLRHSKTKGLSGYDVVVCHIAGRELYYLADDFDLKLSTFLREPVARVFSNYCFWRQFTPDVVLETEAGQVPLVDLRLDVKEDLARIFAHTPDIWKFRELTDVTTWQLATSLYERAGRSQTQALEEAKSRLSAMTFVGFQETLLNDYETLISQIDPAATPSPLEQLNRTRAKSGPVLNPEIRALITRYNALDIELYDWARAQFSPNEKRSG